MTQQSRHGHCASTRCNWGIPPQPWRSRTPFVPRKCPCLNPSTSWAHNSPARAWCSTQFLATPHLLPPHSVISASQSGRSWRPLCMQWGRTLRLSSLPCCDGCSCRWLPTSEASVLVAICRSPPSSTSMMWCSSAPSTCCPPCLPATSRPPHQLLLHAHRGTHQPTRTRVHLALVGAQPTSVPATETRVSG